MASSDFRRTSYRRLFMPAQEIDLPKGRYITSPVWIEKIGGDTMARSCIGAAEEVERGVWFKTNVKREGSRLVATTYLCVAGNPQVFSVSVDLARIAKKIADHHRYLHKTDKGAAVGRAANPGLSRAERRRIMTCRADCDTGLFSGVEDDTLDEIVGCMYRRPTVGRDAIPHYSKALRRRLMTCRADCEQNLVGYELADDLGDTPINQIGAQRIHERARARIRKLAQAKARVGANEGFDAEADLLFAGLFDSVTKPFRKAVEKIGKTKLIQGVTKGLGDAVRMVAEPQKALDLMAKAGNIKIGPVPIGVFYGPWLADQAARKALGKRLYNTGAKMAVNAAMAAFPPLAAANLAARLATAKNPTEAAALIPALKAQPMASNVSVAFTPKVSPEAALAFNASRTALASIEKEKNLRSNLLNVRATLQKLPQLKESLGRMPMPERLAFLQRNPAVKQELFNVLKAKATVQVIKATGGVQKIEKIKKQGMLARSRLKAIADKAAAGDPDAKKLARVVAIVNTARENTRNAAYAARGGFTGVVIDEAGNLTRGRFTRSNKRSSELLLAPGGKKTRGAFTLLRGSGSPSKIGCECD